MTRSEQILRHGMKIKLFMDGADLDEMRRGHEQRSVDGFTTNPTLMRKAGVADYAAFAKAAVAAIPDLPISFEVFADDLDGMEREAHIISGFGANVYVKIPVSNTAGKSCAPLIRKLARDGIRLNITAILTLDQVREVVEVLEQGVPSIVSVFAGRIADTGVDPVPLMTEALKILRDQPAAELLWASPRELLNVVQANAIGCHIITATNDILKKVPLIGKNLAEYSLETVRMFFDDARAARYHLI
jgi:transaldolase